MLDRAMNLVFAVKDVQTLMLCLFNYSSILRVIPAFFARTKLHMIVTHSQLTALVLANLAHRLSGLRSLIINDHPVLNIGLKSFSKNRPISERMFR
jgi:hypothetical protein